VTSPALYNIVVYWIFGADGGNRTRINSLGSYCSTTELHPRLAFYTMSCRDCATECPPTLPQNFRVSFGRRSPLLNPTKRLKLFLRQLHEEPLAPAKTPAIAFNAANKPLTVVVDLDKRSLARLVRCEFSACDRRGYCCKALGCVFCLAQSGQREEDRTVFPRVRNPVETKANGREVAILGQFDGLARDCRFTVEQLRQLTSPYCESPSADRLDCHFAPARMVGRFAVSALYFQRQLWSVPGHIFVIQRSVSLDFSVWLDTPKKSQGPL
jgi:hypothetical protein